jgi:hypothetical protein
VVQERGDLRADDGRRGAAVVVDEPVVHTRAEIGEGVARERRRGCGEGSVAEPVAARRRA